MSNLGFLESEFGLIESECGLFESESCCGGNDLGCQESGSRFFDNIFGFLSWLVAIAICIVPASGRMKLNGLKVNLALVRVALDLGRVNGD